MAGKLTKRDALLAAAAMLTRRGMQVYKVRDAEPDAKYLYFPRNCSVAFCRRPFPAWHEDLPAEEGWFRVEMRAVGTGWTNKSRHLLCPRCVAAGLETARRFAEHLLTWSRITFPRFNRLTDAPTIIYAVICDSWVKRGWAECRRTANGHEVVLTNRTKIRKWLDKLARLAEEKVTAMEDK